MKKCLLINLTLGLSGMLLAQIATAQTSVTPPKINPTLANKAELYKKNQNGATEAASFATLVNSLKPQRNSPTQQLKAYTSTNIGITGYQLQTNASLCNRVILNPDGTIGATWTMSQTNDAAWADRGTGYNYFNGTSWGASPTSIVENIRTGFANIGVSVTGAEYIVTHEASNIHIASRAAKGTGAWTDAALGYPDVWSRFSVGGANGMSLHVISQTTGVGNPPYMGQDGALAYSRSLDGGVTWDKVRTVIPEIDAASYTGFGGDSYSIDAKGDTIAIVIGGFEVDVVLIKSVDNGTSWTKTIVKAFPIPLFNEATMLSDIDGDSVADTIETNDASVHVLLDNQGMAHVWYGNMRMLNDDLTDGGVSYFPGTDGLYYWNQTTVSSPVMIVAAQDFNGDLTLNVTDWGTYQTSLTSHPSAGIAPDGKIYLAYSSIWEGDAYNGTPGDGKSYRHTYIMRSDDGGITWCTPQDVVDPGGLINFTEGVYGAIARDVNGFVHLVVQKDGEPGHGVSGTSDPQTSTADMVYVKVPVADLACGVGINEANEAILSAKLYPNPATSSATLSITALEKANVTVKITNVVGQQVNEFSNDLPSAGVYDLNINLEKFNKGIYFVTLTMNGNSQTKKLIVE